MAIEQLTATTLRNVIGSMTLEEALTGRDHISSSLRTILDEATGTWGVRVNRVEIKAIEPPQSVQQAMESQLTADRQKRAAILTSEGQKQASILTAEGQKQSSILKAEGDQQAAILQAEADRQAAILRAKGEAEAINALNVSLQKGNNNDMLQYRFISAMPQMADKDGKAVFVVPAELSRLAGNLGETLEKQKPAE